MNIYVVRQSSAPTGTPGKLTTQHGWSCDTLEPPWLNNRRGESCIIADSYDCTLWESPTLKRWVVRLEDKHGRENCLIHNANFAATLDDPATPDLEFTQVHGCTAVGRGYGQILLPAKVAKRKGQTQFGIMNSSKTLDELLVEIGAGHHTIHYSWAPGCEPQDLTDALAPKEEQAPAQ